MDSKSNKKGFTLLELLVAIMLLVITLSAVAVAVNGAMKTYTKSVSTSESEILSNTLMQVIGDQIRWSDSVTSPKTTDDQSISAESTKLTYCDSKGITKTIKTYSNGQIVYEGLDGVAYKILNEAAYTSGMSASVSFTAIKHASISDEGIIEKGSYDAREDDLIQVKVSIMNAEGTVICTDTQVFQRVNGWQMGNGILNKMDYFDPTPILLGICGWCQEHDTEYYARDWSTKSNTYNIDSNSDHGERTNPMNNILKSNGIDFSDYGISYWCIQNYGYANGRYNLDEVIVLWTDVDMASSGNKYIRFIRNAKEAFGTVGSSNYIPKGYSVGYVFCGLVNGRDYNIASFPSYSEPTGCPSGYAKHYSVACDTLESAYLTFKNLEDKVEASEAKGWLQQQTQ